ncbi:MAG: PAS domain S-box protein [Marinobacterium sp.]
MQMDKDTLPKQNKTPFQYRLRQLGLPVAIFIVGTVLSLNLAKHEANRQRLELEDRFKATVQQTTRVLQEKVDRFTLLMKAGRGLVLNHPDTPTLQLNRRWHQMFDSYEMRYSDFGIIGLSYTRYIAPDERQAFVDRFNQDSPRKLTIFPPPAPNQPSFLVMHLTPAAVESRMLGYDIYNGDSRRKAALQAMTSGTMSATQPLSLLPTDINSLDYLLLLPVQTNAAFLGWVTLGFSMSQLVQESLNDLTNPLRIQLIDPRQGSQSISYDSHPELGQPEPSLQHAASLTLAGQEIHLQISPLDPDLHREASSQYHDPTLISGLSLTLLVASLLLFFIQARHQALRLSNHMAARADEMYKRYRTLFTQSPEAIVVHVNGVVELANEHAAALFGCNSPDELLQLSIDTLVHPDSLSFVRDRGAALERGEALKPAEQKLMRLDGSTFEAEVSSTMIQYRGKQAIQVMFRDITSDKAQRQESRIAQAVFRHSHDAIMVTDGRGRIELVNAAFQKLTGYAPAAMTGRNVSVLNSGHHDSSFFHRMWMALIDTGEWSGDIVNRTREGRLYIQETNITAVKDEQQQTQHYVCLMRDVTEQRRGLDYTQLQALKEQLAQTHGLSQ